MAVISPGSNTISMSKDSKQYHNRKKQESTNPFYGHEGDILYIDTGRIYFFDPELSIDANYILTLGYRYYLNQKEFFMSAKVIGEHLRYTKRTGKRKRRMLIEKGWFEEFERSGTTSILFPKWKLLERAIDIETEAYCLRYPELFEDFNEGQDDPSGENNNIHRGQNVPGQNSKGGQNVPGGGVNVSPGGGQNVPRNKKINAESVKRILFSNKNKLKGFLKNFLFTFSAVNSPPTDGLSKAKPSDSKISFEESDVITMLTTQPLHFTGCAFMQFLEQEKNFGQEIALKNFANALETGVLQEKQDEEKGKRKSLTAAEAEEEIKRILNDEE